MSDRDDLLGRWLGAERRRDEALADGLLRELFAGLARPMPAAGFAERVLVGLAPPPVARPLALGWRLTLASCLLLVALSVAFVLLLLPLAEMLQVASLVRLGTDGIVLGARALAGWLALWQSLGEANRVLLTLISRPQVATSLFVLAALTTLSFRLLSGLMAPERNPRHG